MKVNRLILAFAVLALAGCHEDELFDGKRGPANAGDAISFGGSLTYKTTRANLTRTVYGEKDAEGTEIKWYEGDSVRIYCAQATVGDGQTTVENLKYCDYGVTGYIEKPKYDASGNITNKTTSDPMGDGTGTQNGIWHESGLAVPEGNPCLRWGTATEPHNFYGVYPTKGQLRAAGDAVAANAYNLTGNTLKAYLPNTQAPTTYVAAQTFTGKNVDGTDNESKHYTIHPAMRNAYMVASTENVSPTAGSVDLVFKPIVTAVEMTLVNNSTHKNAQGNTTGVALTDISLINLTANTAICGAFQANVKTKEISGLSTDQSYYTVGIPVEDEKGQHLTLNYGDKITFTAFLLLSPNTDLESISVSVVAGGTAKSATLTGQNGVKIVQAQKKNFIAEVPISLSTVEEVGLDEWVSSIPNTDSEGKANLLSHLSIPGAGGAASDGLTTDYDKQQTLSITKLWDCGIRCFEFMVDRPSSTSTSLGSMPVVCGIQRVDMTLKEAVDEVVKNLKDHPQEFAVVIIGYQDVDVDSYDRQAGNNTWTGSVGWGYEFHEWWNSYSFSGVSTVDKTITHAKAELTSTTTVEAARGKLFCIVRPMCIGIDGGWYTGIADGNQKILSTDHIYNASTGPYVSALGWGNHPDHWYARGYGNLVTTSNATFTANQGGVADRPYEVYKGTKPTNTTDITYTVPAKKSFAYKFINKANTPWSDISDYCWVQDWRRVVPDATIRTQYGIKAVTEATAQNGYNNGSSESWYYKWAPSVDEKWNDIVNTLNLSMGDASDNSYSYGLYINSLCGYFVDGDIPLSYQPRATFQRYNNVYYLDDKYNTTDYVGAANLRGDGDKPNRNTSWGPYHTIGGNEGNIAAYADWINNKFYNLLLTMQANNTLNGPTGIVMMDRVSDTADDPAGYYIPQIIISNNFAATTSDISIEYSTFEAGDTRTLQVAE